MKSSRSSCRERRWAAPGPPERQAMVAGAPERQALGAAAPERSPPEASTPKGRLPGAVAGPEQQALATVTAGVCQWRPRGASGIEVWCVASGLEAASSGLEALTTSGERRRACLPAATMEGGAGRK
jgi:hypothetical protein